jgi:hypothetical protein
MSDLRLLRVFECPSGRYRLEAEDRCYLTFRPVWSVPLSQPGRYLALLDAKDKEIVTVEDPSSLPDEVWRPVQDMLRERYLSPTVRRILSIRNEFGVTYWNTETDRGPRDFVTQSLQENAHWLAPGHLVVTDVDGNRFDVRIGTLDADSRKLLGLAV